MKTYSFAEKCNQLRVHFMQKNCNNLKKMHVESAIAKKNISSTNTICPTFKALFTLLY